MTKQERLAARMFRTYARMETTQTYKSRDAFLEAASKYCENYFNEAKKEMEREAACA